MVVDKLNKPACFKRVYFPKVPIVVETPKCNAEPAETYFLDATKVWCVLRIGTPLGRSCQFS